MRFLVGNRDAGKVELTPHVCYTLTLAEIVKAGLEAEFGTPCSIVDFGHPAAIEEQVFLDFGGCIMEGWKSARFRIDRAESKAPIYFEFMPHHLYSVVVAFNRALADVKTGGFISMPGANTVICMFVEDAQLVFEQIKQQMGFMKALHDNHLNQWESWLKNQRQNPHPTIALPKVPDSSKQQ